MVMRLSGALDVGLRDQNVLLLSAGFDAGYSEPPLEALRDGPIRAALDRMLAQQEPYPLTILDRRYDVVEANAAATRIFTRFVADPSALDPRPNILRMLFDPRLARPFVAEWERVAKSLLVRLHRERLERPSDGELGDLLASLFDYPDVPRDWQQPDLSWPSEPCMTFRVERGDEALAFLTTVTVFNAPQNVTLEELRIESYFPLDERTTRRCEQLAREG